MQIIRYIILFGAILGTIVMAALGIFVVPVALFFTSYESEHLHWLFWLWDNHEDEAGGINGDYNWVYRIHGGDKEIVRRPFWRYVWLAFRNPCHNFVKFVIGILKPVSYTYSGDDWETVSKQGGWHIGYTNGLFLQLFLHNKKRYLRIGWRYVGDKEPSRFAMVWNPSKLRGGLSEQLLDTKYSCMASVFYYYDSGGAYFFKVFRSN